MVLLSCLTTSPLHHDFQLCVFVCYVSCCINVCEMSLLLGTSIASFHLTWFCLNLLDQTFLVYHSRGVFMLSFVFLEHFSLNHKLNCLAMNMYFLFNQPSEQTYEIYFQITSFCTPDIGPFAFTCMGYS